MLDDYTLPRFLDSRPVFQIGYDDERDTFRAYACSRDLRRWVQVRSSSDFDELHRKCEAEGMSYYGATYDALYRYQFGLAAYLTQ